MVSLQALFWKTFYSRWRTQCAQRQPGYTILLPVPGDLPVFLELALLVCGRLNPEHLVETLVIPDIPTAACHEIVKRVGATWKNGGLRLVELPWLDRQVTTRLNKPHSNHWLQLINGVENTRTTHALLHDADAFLFDPDCLKRQYERCVQRQLSCLGMTPVWDKWFREKGYDITATWELMFDVEWLRSAKPWLHLGHDNVLNGEKHTFDTTLWLQCQTPKERVGYEDAPEAYVHFNYVISTYRWFQKSQGPYEDEHFRLLLVRLLIDLFDRSGWSYEVPTVSDLEKGLREPGRRVVYQKPETASHYPEFRGKLQKLIGSPLLNAEQGQRLREGVRPFDAAFRWNAGS